MKRKIYAVRYRNGQSRLYVGTWDEVKDHIDGKKGVAYKGFPHTALRDAEDWLARKAIPYRTKRTPHVKDKIYLYVDGSFTTKTMRAGWGWVAIQNGVVIAENWGSIGNVKGSRNIVGELQAAMQAMAWAVRQEWKKVIVVHDYAGIGLWALGYWRAKKFVSKEYKEFFEWTKGRIEVSFEKVNGHCGIKWNDYVDALTRKYMETNDERKNA